MALGSLGFFGWLTSTGGIGSEGDLFIMLGIAALGGGPVLFVIGLDVVSMASQSGKSTEVPPLSRTKWTRRVPHPVLIGHAASLTPY